jgi:phosphatidate cytidylyltransferase
MKRVLTAVVLIPLVLGAVWLLPSDWFLLLLGITALLAAREFLLLVLLPGESIFYRSAISVLAVIFGSAILMMRMDTAESIAVSVTGSILALAPLLFLGIGLKLSNPRRGMESAALSFFGIFYVGVPLLSIWIIRNHIDESIGPFLVLVLLATVWSGDIAALYVGKMIGRHKLAPSVSPGKTWEGSFASVIFASLICWGLFAYVGPRYGRFACCDLPGITAPYWLSIGIGALINVAAQIGDLAESMIKRAAGVKDSGKLLPGHGGVLDRIDALLFGAPVGMLLFWSLKQSFIFIRAW